MGEEMDSQKFWARLQSVGGASIVTLYKGPPLLHQVTHATYLEPEHYMSSSKSQNWTWGCIFLFGHCISWAGWMVLQVSLFILTVNKFPLCWAFAHLATKFMSWRSHKCFAGSLVEEAPSKTHTHFIHMLFAIDSILSNRSICGNWHQSLENPIWRRAFHYLLCCNNFDFNTLHSNMI